MQVINDTASLYGVTCTPVPGCEGIVTVSRAYIDNLNYRIRQLENCIVQLERELELRDHKIEQLESELEHYQKELCEKGQMAEQLKGENAKLAEDLEQAKQEASELSETVKELKAKLNQDSTNSHKPPSSDGLKKPNTESLRKTGGKKGAPEGHEGHTLQPSDSPDEVIEHKVHVCKNCKTPLEDVPVEGVVRRQLVEIPKVEVKYIEHRTESKKCPCCGELNKAEFPEGLGLNAPVQYGPNFKAMVVSFRIAGMCSLRRTKKLVHHITGHSISEATVLSIEDGVSEGLSGTGEKIRKDLKKSEVLHADETGVRVNGKTYWVHTVCNEESTAYHLHEKRGYDAMAEHGLLTEYEGVVVHDCFSAYFREEMKFDHSLCGVHLLRELKSVKENFDHRWAHEMYDLLYEVHRLKEKAKEQESIQDDRIQEICKRYDEIIEIGEQETGIDKEPDERPKKRGRPKRSTSANLLMRMKKMKEFVLRPLHDPRVPFSNNQAERDIRMVKVKCKISGCFRTFKGAERFLRIVEFIYTRNKRGIDALALIPLLLTGTKVDLNPSS